VQGDETVKQSALALLSMLRSEQIPAEAVFGKSFKAQMRRAGKSGYPLCAILGEDEVSKSIVTVKDLRNSSQIQVDRAGVLDKVKSMLDE
jgi:histidyl-tRNA synthetase